MSCPHWRRRWRVSALESCGRRTQAQRTGATNNWLTDWAKDMQLKAKTGRERDTERGGGRERRGVEWVAVWFHIGRVNAGTGSIQWSSAAVRPSDYGGIKAVTKFGVIIHSEQVHVRYSDVSFIAGLGNYYLCILQKGDVFLFREMNNIILCLGGLLLENLKCYPQV